MADKRIIELEERLTLSDGDYFATDNTNGTCKVNAKILLDRFSDDEDAIATKAAKVDLTNISITGSTNNTGSTIASGTYFYKDGTLVKAIAAIANGATLTLNTNYAIVTAGGLNDLNNALSKHSYGTGTDKNLNETHTADSDGILVWDSRFRTQYANWYLEINGVRVLSSAKMDNGSTDLSFINNYKVKKGDTYKCVPTNANITHFTFYPIQ